MSPPPSPPTAPAAIEPRQEGLDLLRALAILPVLLFHAPGSVTHDLPEGLRHAFTFGWMGVDLFFVLSGYLIGRQVFTARQEAPAGALLREFWVKRWTRTLPLYFVVLGTYALLKPHVFQAPFVGGGWHYALFLQNYTPLFDFVQSWSLCVEEHFYLVLPVLAFGLGGRRWPAAVWLVPGALSLVGRVLVSRALPENLTVLEVVPLLQWPTHLHLDGMALGVFLARTAPHWRQWPARWKAASAALGVGVLAVTLALCGPTLLGHARVWVFTGLSVGFALLVVGLEAMRLPRWARKAVYTVAVTSYGTYLWHGLVVRFFDRMNFSLGFWVLDLVFFLAVTVGVAWGTYLAVEKPGLKLRGWWLEPSGRPAPARAP
ncbi:acyltransferase family protein [Stigmatella aurantiaca]|uniref:Acyltransferase family protein n=2 Tax=Stigmatella aurantiaca (strain DW4/3-1) TaxID=378806 RepID=E3FNX4_STIAD|nr:acyltransferase [Stigmatella aurantiaca]ADO69398.1 Acyltransferase family protein [Stigmatella aurantiaca DW4/3-1]